MDILEKIAVKNVTQNVEAVIFTMAYAILDVNQDGKERTVLKVLFLVKKKKSKNKKQKHTFYVVSGLFPVLSIYIASLFCQLSQTKLLKLFRKMALPFFSTLLYLVYDINKTMF